MNLNISIDSKSFEKVLNDGINSLSQDEIKSIVKEALFKALTTVPDFRNMLVYKNHSYDDSYRLGPLAEKCLGDLPPSPEIEEIRKKMINALVTNHKQLVEHMIFRLFMKSMLDDYEFRTAMHAAASEVLREQENIRNQQ